MPVTALNMSHALLERCAIIPILQVRKMTHEIQICMKSLLQIPSEGSTEPFRTRIAKQNLKVFPLQLKNVSDQSCADFSPEKVN